MIIFMLSVPLDTLLHADRMVDCRWLYSWNAWSCCHKQDDWCYPASIRTKPQPVESIFNCEWSQLYIIIIIATLKVPDFYFIVLSFENNDCPKHVMLICDFLSLEAVCAHCIRCFVKALRPLCRIPSCQQISSHLCRRICWTRACSNKSERKQRRTLITLII